ncbi:SH3 domain-containing protein [Streptomyces yaizuensis]|uniref:SH3 domain-containing protein n=1 Tax=Streptomyces yaizuensis TaxID=2989713 RepID=A0ABQ5P679_9ACTN|nr:SH3 domain-containing protein [Streptomyces sp. YSPA8]GLF98064.1 SH3 domain-containing protein [Streptomyces sp. YSPA8]
MRPLIRKAITATAATALTLGGVTALASPASAAGTGSCTKNVPDYNGWAYTTVNLRKGPGISHTSLGLLQPRTKITVHCYAKSSTWAHIKVRSGANSGKSGWISAYYIDIPMNLN